MVKEEIKGKVDEIWKEGGRAIILGAVGFGSWAWIILKGMFSEKD